jgi:hypothetical protein
MNYHTLYDKDYNEWIQETLKQIKAKNFEKVDWNNLIEEIESLGKSERRALLSLFTQLLEHLLKMSYWDAEKERNYRHWASEVVNFRAQIESRLEDSPSLRRELPIFYERAHSTAIKSVSKLFTLDRNASISLENALEEEWFPEL